MSLTLDEKKLINKIKRDLIKQKIPRSQWIAIIQDEIGKQRKFERKNKKNKSKIKIFFDRNFKMLKKKVLKFFTKRALNGKNIDDRTLDEMMKMMSGEDPSDPNNLSNLMPNLMPSLPKESEIANHGTFLTKEQEKTKKIVEVFFDDDFDEDD